MITTGGLTGFLPIVEDWLAMGPVAGCGDLMRVYVCRGVRGGGRWAGGQKFLILIGVICLGV